MRMRKIMAPMLSLVMVASLFSGCTSSSKDEPKKEATSTQATSQPAKTAAPKQEEIYIPVISKGFQHQFWQAVKMGAEKAAKEFNVKITFEGPESESQVDKQLEMLETALGKNPKAICLAALDSKAALPLLQKCKDKGIPVIGFDSGVDSEIPVATCSTDNAKAAAYAADKMAEAIGKSGEIAVIAHDQTSKTGVDRREGFLNQIKAKYPDIKVVDVQYCAGDQLKAADIAKTILQSKPNIKGIFGTNEGAATGAMKGIIEAKKDGKVTVIGYDAGKAQKDAVRSKQMYGAITQDPVGIGYKAVEAAVKAIKGEKVEKNIDTGFKWYDSTNIDSADLKPLLYD